VGLLEENHKESKHPRIGEKWRTCLGGTSEGKSSGGRKGEGGRLGQTPRSEGKSSAVGDQKEGKVSLNIKK